MMTQEIIAAKSAKLQSAVAELVGIVAEAVDQKIAAHVVEQSVLKKVLAVGRMTMELLFDHLGVGDVGETCCLADGRVLNRLAETRNRSYQTVFGTFELKRCVYATREGQKAELIPLDARLQLPESKFSYLLQDFDQHLTMEEPFQQVAQTIQRILDVRQHVDSLERMNQAIAAHVEEFHSQQEPPVYSVDPYQRTPEDVVEALFRDPRMDRKDQPSARPRPCHKRVRACLNFTDSDGDELLARPALFGGMADEVKARNPDGAKPVICIRDGQADLWTEIDVFQPASERVEILDLLHVTPRLWKAARLFSSGQTAVASFVRSRLLNLLRGEVAGVIRGLKRMAALRNLSGPQRKTIAVICAYLSKNRHRLRYHEYLAKGDPIASGVIEGACRHVVKDRLERTGMNWTVPGAKAMLELRCVHLSGDWDNFIETYITSDTARLHPYRKLLDTLPWSTLTTAA